MKLALDAGHGINTAGKRTPDDIREWTLNDRVVSAMIVELNKYDIEVVRLDDPTGVTDVRLTDRDTRARGCDVLLSIHHNAYVGAWGNHGGTETLIQTDTQANRNFATAMNNAVVGALGLRNRGVKIQNTQILRNFKGVAACLVEVGFMDSTTDKVVREQVNSVKVAKAIVQALADHFDLKKTNDVSPTPAPTKKSNEDVAKEVLIGKWGNGDERKKRLTDAGYNYSTIQAIVNGATPAKPAPKPVKKTNVQIADEVINGKWGNDPKRSEDLKKAGYDPVAIQTEVNKKLGGSKPTATPIKKGDKVSVVNNVQYNGGRFSVLRSSYDVIEIKGDRVVIGVGKAVTVAINVVNLKKV